MTTEMKGLFWPKIFPKRWHYHWKNQTKGQFLGVPEAIFGM
jgi:hypothetical protein